MPQSREELIFTNVCPRCKDEIARLQSELAEMKSNWGRCILKLDAVEKALTILKQEA